MSGVNDIKLKKFVSEDEIEARRKRRQEEWEKVRTEDQPAECPEEVVETRSLYDRLEEQKQKKEDEYAEKHRLSNQVKGLKEDEVAFLDHVSQRQTEIEKEHLTEQQAIIKEIQENNVVTIENRNRKNDVKSHTTKAKSTNPKSQMVLLAGAVKRKSDAIQDDKDKNSPNDATISTSNANISAVTTDTSSSSNYMYPSAHVPAYIRPSATSVAAILPGIGNYGSDSSDSSDTDSDDNDNYAPFKRIRMVQRHDDGDCQCHG